MLSGLTSGLAGSTPGGRREVEEPLGRRLPEAGTKAQALVVVGRSRLGWDSARAGVGGAPSGSGSAALS